MYIKIDIFEGQFVLEKQSRGFRTNLFDFGRICLYDCFDLNDSHDFATSGG